MASVIKILPEHLANKIAAGEVVQRPASVIKELLENAIDAKATSLTVILKDAGKTLIHVVDDGEGMIAEDAKLAFARHSTSKIASYEDLENIQTFGFRGEALASIAAIAQVELKTRRREHPVGTRVNVHGSKIIDSGEDACPAGTSIQVKNLFYNTPGRRNFLKSNSTEFHHCLNVVHRIALAYPEIAVTFYSDGEKIFSLNPDKLQRRIGDIFGDKVSQSLFYFDGDHPSVKLHGFLGKPEYSRKTRLEQFIFLNRRYIINKSISHAVLKGYEHLLEKGNFPFFILFLDLDPHTVDVNVHPSKMEVKLEDESAIYRVVFHGVRQALSGHDLLPEMEMKDRAPHSDLLSFNAAGPGQESMKRVVNWRDLLGEKSNVVPTLQPAPGITQTGHPLSTEESDMVTPRPSRSISRTSSGEGESKTFIGEPRLMQLHSKYIVIPIDGGVLLVDQHAAHERVLYEKIVDLFGKHSASTQNLLFPIVNEMPAGDVELVKEIFPLLEDLGFMIKIFGRTTIILEGVPVDVRPGYEKTILQDILDLYKEDEHQIELQPREKLAKSYSCRAAVKAGDPLTQSEMHALLDQLFVTKVPFVCPHGRPVSIKISLSELDKRFGRTS